MYSQAVLLGVLVSLLYTELTGYSAGLVVPAYLAMNLHSPLRVGYTLLVALGAVILCRALAQVMILYGRRRFAVLILLTFLIGWLPGLSGGIFPGNVDVIGYMIPGIIAREMDRQGVAAALLSLAVTTGLVGLLLTLIGYPVGW